MLFNVNNIVYNLGFVECYQHFYTFWAYMMQKIKIIYFILQKNDKENNEKKLAEYIKELTA